MLITERIGGGTVPPTIESGRCMARIGDKAMSRKMWLCVLLAVCASMIAIKTSQAAEPLLTIIVDDRGDIVDVYDKDGSLTSGPLQMPLAIDDLQMAPTLSLSFAEVLMADGSVAWCRPCGGRWCRPWLEELRYFLGDRAQIVGVQGRVEDKWVDLRLDFPDEYVAEESEALDEIVSLKTHTLVALENGDGSRRGIVISGLQVSSTGVDDSKLLMWSSP
jgi:hypothetical protein